MQIIEIIDWYDGPLEAIYSLSDSSLYFYCSVVFWNIENDKRVYVCFPIDYRKDEILSLVKEKLSGGNWAEIRKLVNDFIESYRGDAEIRVGDKSFENSITKGYVNIKQVKGQIGRGVEFVLEPEQVAIWSNV